MNVKLITFDVTNTLLQIRGSVGEHYAAVANKYYGATKQMFDADKTEKAFVEAYKKVSREKPNFGYSSGISSENWWHELVHNVFFSLGLRDIGIMKSISNQLYTDYCRTEKYELFPEVKEVLKELRKNSNIKLGVISNFDDRLELLLDQLEIRQYFDMVLCSRLLGMAKPDARIFSTALALSGVQQPCEALHIGDNIDLDYHAAQAIGFDALLIRRGDRKVETLKNGMPIKVIDSLESILDCVAKDDT